jgi:hypothetical protein
MSHSCVVSVKSDSYLYSLPLDHRRQQILDRECPALLRIYEAHDFHFPLSDSLWSLKVLSVYCFF